MRSLSALCAACAFASSVAGAATVEISNGSMTNGDATPLDWKCGPSFTFARDTEDYKSAPASMRVMLAEKTGGNVTQELTPAPGQTITISGWSKAKTEGKALAQYQVAVMSFDSDRKKIAWQDIMMRIAWRDEMTHDWTAFSKSIEIPAKTHSMALILYLNGKGTVWFDDLRVGGGAGGGGDQTPQAARPKSKPRGDGACFLRRRDTILVLGDAVAAEGGVYRALLDDFQREYPDVPERERPRLANAASPGATASSILRMLPGSLDAKRPDVVVVSCGANDSYRDSRGFATSMKGIVRMLKAKSKAVTLLTPPPIDASKRPELAARAAALDEMVGQLRRIAAEEDVLLADCYGKMRRSIASGTSLDWGDGVHPNARGRGMMAECLRDAWGFGKPVE